MASKAHRYGATPAAAEEPAAAAAGGEAGGVLVVESGEVRLGCVSTTAARTSTSVHWRSSVVAGVALTVGCVGVCWGCVA
jgi:hypothetical protein